MNTLKPVNEHLLCMYLCKFSNNNFTIWMLKVDTQDDNDTLYVLKLNIKY